MSEKKSSIEIELLPEGVQEIMGIYELSHSDIISGTVVFMYAPEGSIKLILQDKSGNKYNHEIISSGDVTGVLVDLYRGLHDYGYVFDSLLNSEPRLAEKEDVMACWELFEPVLDKRGSEKKYKVGATIKEIENSK